MIPAASRRLSFGLMGAVLLAPVLLFAAGVLTPVYFLAAFAAVLFLAMFVVNFETGFIALIFVRSSLDYFKQFTPGGGPNVSAVAGVLLILLGCFYILYRRINIFEYEESRPFLIFLAVCGVSIFFSKGRLESVSDWLRLCSVFFVYVFARHITRTREKLKIILLLVLWSALVPVAVAFAQMVSGTGRGHGRLTGTFYHPNAFASYLLVLLVMVAPQILEGRSLLKRSMLLPFAAAAFMAFVLTFSRGAWIVFVAAMLVMGILRYRKLLVLIPVLIVAVAVLIPGVTARVKDVTDPSSHRGRSAWEWRLDAWRELAPLVREKPVFGHGIAMVNTQMGFMAHNDYLRLAIEVGIVGLLSYLYLIRKLLGRTWEDFRRARSATAKSFQLGLFSMLVALVIREVADNTLRNTVVLLYFWIFVAVARNAALLDRADEMGGDPA